MPAMITLASRNRRNFLRFLAGSPLMAMPSMRAWAQQVAAAAPGAPVHKSAKDFLDVMEFREAVRAALPPAHWGYMASGVDDDLTLNANMSAFKHYQLKPRRLVDVSKSDLKIDVFGAACRLRMWPRLSGPRPGISSTCRSNGGDTEKLVKRVEDAGCPALAWTVDLLAGRNTETATRFRLQDTRDCMTCHVNGVGQPIHRPMLEGIDSRYNPPEATWSHVERAAETLRATVDCLPEVVEAVNGRIPVPVDGGFHRGTDIFKALALGARAVGVGRPHIWGLSAFGQDGVERVLDILRAELTLTMRQMGAPPVREITRAHVVRA
jgi:4-hydroxymandelate oxidase